MKVRNIVLITAGCCAIAGAVISGIAASMMVNTHVYEDKPVTQEITEKVNKIDITSEYGDINILPAENDKITIDYTECEINRYNINVNNGILMIKPSGGKINKGLSKTWFDRIFQFDFHRHESYTINIRVPRSMALDIAVNNDCGAVEIADGKFKNINCELDYGGLKVSNVTANSLNIESDCGDVELNAVTADIKAECDLGEIRFEGISGRNITLNNDCGDIKGTIRGKEEDYTINVEIEAGNKNITNRTGGQNRLNVSVDMGSIDIKFEN